MWIAKLNNEWGHIWVFARKNKRVDGGWMVSGIYYDNCIETPDWHIDPMPIMDDEIDVWFRTVENA